jgi:hypothetical protein
LPLLVDGCFACVSERTANILAKEFECYLPTQKIVDELYKQSAYRVKPITLSYGPEMETVGQMRKHSALVMKEIEKFGCPLDVGIQSVGKHWILTNELLGQPNKACNYGWFGGPYHSDYSNLPVWQDRGFAHNKDHVDYSQTLTLVSDHMFVNGHWASLKEIGENPEYAPLITYEGTVEYWGYSGSEEKVPDTEPVPDTIPEGKKPVLGYKRLLLLRHPYLQGEDVRAWREYLGLSPGYSFDEQVHLETQIWQEGKKDPQTGNYIGVDGKVGPQTIRTANAYSESSEPPEIVGFSVDAFKQAKNYRWSNREKGDVKYLVIHDAEIDELPYSAENLMHWAAGPNAPVASWHYAVDVNSITQSVKEASIAWHAPGVNDIAIGVEFAGRRAQSRKEWLDAYGKEMLERGAWLFAQVMKRWDIPLKFINREGLKRGEPGITTHEEVTYAFRKSTHIDPGPNFPMEYFFERIQSYL